MPNSLGQHSVSAGIGREIKFDPNGDKWFSIEDADASVGVSTGLKTIVSVTTNTLSEKSNFTVGAGLPKSKMIEKLTGFQPDLGLSYTSSWEETGTSYETKDRYELIQVGNVKWSHVFGQVCSVSKVYRV